LYVCDNTSPVYRITCQEYAAKKTNYKRGKFILEFNYDVLNELLLDTDDKIIEYMNLFLIQNNIIHKPLNINEITIKTLKNAVNMPTLYNFSNFTKLATLTQNLLPEVELIGPACGFVATSFNDQVVQALKIGKKYN